jgi:hypothetical protein
MHTTTASEDDMNITMDDLNQYYTQLERHDWFYDYSDDYSVWARGCTERSRLRGMASKHPRFDELYRAFSTWVYDKSKPKPERPN